MKSKGFTLVEVILSAAIMSGVLVGILSLFVYCFNLQETSRNKSSALFQMRGKLEELRSMDFDDLITFVALNYTASNDIAFNGSQGYYYQEFPLESVGQAGVVRVEVAAPSENQDFNDAVLLDLRAISGWKQKVVIIGEIYDSGGGIFKFSDQLPPEGNGNDDGILGYAAAFTTAISKAGA